MGAKMQNADDGESKSPYVSHDTNATIKSYHAYLKATLKTTKSQLFGRQVGWCIYQLLEGVLLHYWYKSLRNNWGFIPNRE
jgi:hypothetical protein